MDTTSVDETLFIVYSGPSRSDTHIFAYVVLYGDFN